MSVPRARTALIAPLVVGALLRALLTWDALDGPPIGDEVAMIRDSRIWLEHGLYPGMWPPGYPWVLTVLHGIFGEGWITAAKWLNWAASVGTLGLVVLLAQRLGGRRAAVAAAWIGALYLSLATWSALLYTESLFLVVVLAVVLLALRAAEAPESSPRTLVIAGLLAGLGCTLRAAGVPVFTAVAVGVGISVLRSRRRERTAWLLSARTVLLMLLPALLVIAPRAIRDGQVTGQAAWLSPTGNSNVTVGWMGLVIRFERAGIDDERVFAAPLGGLREWLETPGPSIPTPEELRSGGPRSESSRARVRYVLANHPGWAVRSRITNLSDMWSPVSFSHRSLRMGQYEAIASRAIPRRALALGGVLASLAVFGLAVVGAARAAAPAAWWWVFGAVTLAHCAIPILMFGISRFRAPLDALLVVAAALALAAPRERSRARTALGVAFGAMLVGLLAVALPLVWAILEASW